MSDAEFSTSFQKSIIDVAFNTFLTGVLLLGAYTVVYFSTLYIYLTKKSAHHWIVAVTISLLYILYAVQISVQWQDTRRTFVDEGQTQETTFIAALSTRPWVTFVNATCSLLEGTIADGLLLWRCFNVWDGSVRIIALPSFLLLCEIALNLTVIVMSSPNNYSSNQIETLNRLIGAATFMTFGTTLIATLLISYRIHSVSKEDFSRTSWSRFMHILEILIQSAAIYSVIAAASAIATIIPVPLDNNGALRLLTTQVQTSILYSFIAGVAPTVIVARVALAKEAGTEISTATHISGLRFHDRFAASNSSESRISQVEHGNPTSLSMLEITAEKKGGS